MMYIPWNQFFTVIKTLPLFKKNGYNNNRLLCIGFPDTKTRENAVLHVVAQEKVTLQLLTSVLFFSLPVKPQIYEKAVSSFPDPTLYLLGSRQTLTCTVYGIPQPTVTWFWRPCNHSHSKAR